LIKIAVNQNYTGDNGLQIGLNNGTINYLTPKTLKSNQNVNIISKDFHLSDEAMMALKEAALSKSGDISAMKIGLDFTIRINGRDFAGKTAREEAHLKEILEELESADLIFHSGEGTYKLTEQGHKMAERIS